MFRSQNFESVWRFIGFTSRSEVNPIQNTIDVARVGTLRRGLFLKFSPSHQVVIFRPYKMVNIISFRTALQLG